MEMNPDFDELKNKLAFLEEQLDFYKTIADNTSDWQVFRDNKGKVLFVNQAFETITGFSTKDFIEGLITEKEIVHPADWERISAEMQKAFKGQAVSDLEFRIICKNSEPRYINLNAIPVFKNNEFIGVRSSARNVTDHKVFSSLNESIAALDQSEEQYRLLFNNMTNGFVLGKVVLDTAGNPFDLQIELVNRKIEELTEKKPEEIIGLNISDLLTIKHQSLFLKFCNVGLTGLPIKEEYYSYTFNRYFIAYAYCPKPGFVAIILEDTTSNKLAERALKQSESKTNAILRALPDMMFIQDLDGVYIDFYLSDEAITYAPPKAFLGQKMENVLPANIVNDFIPIFNKAIETKQMQLFEYSLQLHDKLRHYESRTISFENDKVLSIVRDITIRKDALQALEQTRENYETFFNTIDDFLFVLDEMGGIVQVNKTVIERLGYSTEEIIGQNVIQLHPESQREQAKKIIGEMLEGKTDFCPIPLITKTGKKIDVETRVSRGIWNNVPVLFGVTKDITKLKLSEEKFAMAFNSNSALIALSYLVSGKFIDVNEAFLQTLEFERNEVIGKTAADLNLFANENEREKYTKLFKTKTFEKEEEIRFRSKSGKIRTGLLSIERISIGGQFILLSTMVDITARKESEIALKESEIRFKQISSSISDIAYSCISDEKGDFLIDWIMGAVEEITGYTEQELMRIKCWGKLVIKEDFHLFKKNVLELKPNESKYCELRIHNKSENLVWIGSYAECKESIESNTHALFGGLINITSQKKNQDELILLNQRLKELNESKDRFISILAHDLKSPFTTLLGFSELLHRNINKYSTEKIAQQVDFINSTAKKIYNLLDDILLWARIQYGQIDIEIHYLKFFEIGSEIIESMRIFSEAKNILLELKTENDLEIHTDPNILKTVLRNLLSNAIKFTHSGGRVVIEANRELENIIISVKDTGIGIEKENLAKLFNISNVFTTEGTSHEKGTGLGLIICKEFIEKQNGKIWVKSEPGIGSTFSFSLPLKSG